MIKMVNGTGVIGFLVCSHDDLDLSKTMYPTLIRSLKGLDAYGLVCVDAGSEDGSVDWWESRCATVHKGNDDLCKVLETDPKDLQHLSVALNAGARHLFNGGCQYICHIHPDMEFNDDDWATHLRDYIENNEKAGKIGSDWEMLRHGTRTGNQCPWMMSRPVIEDVIEKYGWLFDPGYVNIGGYEDWDLNRRLVRMGYEVTICGDSMVKHEGMGTRSRKNTRPDQIYNCNYYYSKWGDTAEVLKPEDGYMGTFVLKESVK